MLFMKNLFLASAFLFLCFNGMSQTTFTINNDTDFTLTVGVQLSDQSTDDCTISASFSTTLGPDESVSFPGVGSQYPVVWGCAGAPGSGWIYNNPTCGASAPGPYIIMPIDWNEISIE